MSYLFVKRRDIMEPVRVQQLRVVWLIALVCATGFALFGYGLLAAVLTAAAFVGATVLAVVAFVLYLILGDVSAPVRILVITLLFVGLLVEFRGIVAVLELAR
jgi:hypothetical protein